MRPGFQSSAKTYCSPIIEIRNDFQSHTNRLVKLQSNQCNIVLNWEIGRSANFVDI